LNDGFNACEWLLDRRVADGSEEAVAIRTGGASVTYGELLERVQAAAGGLLSLDVRPEERVLMVMVDELEFVVTFLAALRIGAVPVPLNPQLRPAELSTVAADARARVAVVSGQRAGLAPALVGVSQLVVTGSATVEPTSGVAVRSWAADMTAPVPVSPYAAGEDFPGFWLCTGGTTGHPKLAMHRHGDLPVTVDTYAIPVLGLTAADRCFSVGPLFHAYGLGNSMTFPLAVGGSSVLDPTRPPTPTGVAAVVAAERPTLFFCIPTFYAALLASDIPGDTFASVRLGVSAAEPLPGDIWRRFQERFGVEILDGIGSTEALHIFISNRPRQSRAGSSGEVVPGWEARIVDDDGVSLPDGQAGHLLIKGPSAASGYWCQTARSRQTFQGEWTRTGDVYVRSTDGTFSYMGRSDDMIKVSGEWVSPAEVEAAIIEHPDVMEAAVVAASDGSGLAKPVAFVVFLPGHEAVPEDVMDFCHTRLAGFKCPRRIVTADDLPRTATGKIQRFALRDRAGDVLQHDPS
jgi:benzoate-CoA ligase family protein